MSSASEMAALVRKLRKHGWRYEVGGRHGRLIAPSGAVIITPLSCSDTRGHLNKIQDIRRYAAPSDYAGIPGVDRPKRRQR